jgi:hypothetical protein
MSHDEDFEPSGSEADFEPSGSEGVSIRDAYLAMYWFVDAYWKRGGRRDDAVALLRHALGPIPDPQNPMLIQTCDPASWSDWLDAVRTAKSEGLPEHL